MKSDEFSKFYMAEFDKFLEILSTFGGIRPWTSIIACLYYIHYFSHIPQKINKSKKWHFFSNFLNKFSNFY